MAAFSTALLGRFNRILFAALMALCLVAVLPAGAAPYAALVMDARSGKVLYARNANTKLHPASLTKMMTLYVTFQAVENGEITMDTLVTVSRKAAAEPPSELGVRAGQKIKLRYLVRAAAIKSANDASTAIAEAIGGSVAGFTRRMNQVAKQMGMNRTHFKNAHGLTQAGHVSTARDMTILGRHLIFDYRPYYNLFSRRSEDAGVRRVTHTNRKLLDSYRGADGIKTGYTRAAGFNLVASAKRGNERIIATVFGGRSVATRNAKVAELLDMGFRRAPSRVAQSAPRKPAYLGRTGTGGVKRLSNATSIPGTAGKVVRSGSAAVARSLRPVARGSVMAAKSSVIADDTMRDLLAEAQKIEVVSATQALPQITALDLTLEGAADTDPDPAPTIEIVSRRRLEGARIWAVSVGAYPSKFHAEKALLKTALLEMETLGGTSRRVVRRNGRFDAQFQGLTELQADLACRRLQARRVACEPVGASG